MEVRVDTGDLEGLLSRAERVASPDASLRRFIALYLDVLRELVPVRSGSLRDSLRATYTADGALVEAAVPYAIYVVLGVRPQWMTWLVGHTVSFVAKDGARVVRRVTRVGTWGGRRHWWHPGTEPNDVFRKALDDGRVVRMLDELAAAGLPVQVSYTYPARGPR